MLLFLVLLSCDPTLLAKAIARAEALDLRGALELVHAAGDCDDAEGGAEYLEGLIGSEEAFDRGGAVDSLREVRSAANALARRAEGGDRRWEAAALALRAVAAATQQERSETALFLAEATRVEALLFTAGLKGVPFVSAHELAGDLWLRLHQFADARAAYLRAAALVGSTPRIKKGIARAEERLKKSGPE